MLVVLAWYGHAESCGMPRCTLLSQAHGGVRWLGPRVAIHDDPAKPARQSLLLRGAPPSRA